MRSHDLSADDTSCGGGDGGLFRVYEVSAFGEDVGLPQLAVGHDLEACLDFGFKGTPSHVGAEVRELDQGFLVSVVSH